MPAKPVDQDDVDGLDLYADNDEPMYHENLRLIARMCRFIERGTYDPKRAPLLWTDWYIRAAEMAREYDERYPAAVRREAARQRAEHEYRAVMDLEYLGPKRRETLLPADQPTPVDIARATRLAIEYDERDRTIRKLWVASIHATRRQLQREQPTLTYSQRYDEASRIVGPMPPVPDPDNVGPAF